MRWLIRANTGAAPCCTQIRAKPAITARPSPTSSGTTISERGARSDQDHQADGGEGDLGQELRGDIHHGGGGGGGPGQSVQRHRAGADHEAADLGEGQAVGTRSRAPCGPRSAPGGGGCDCGMMASRPGRGSRTAPSASRRSRRTAPSRPGRPRAAHCRTRTSRSAAARDQQPDQGQDDGNRAHGLHRARDRGGDGQARAGGETARRTTQQEARVRDAVAPIKERQNRRDMIAVVRGGAQCGWPAFQGAARSTTSSCLPRRPGQPADAGGWPGHLGSGWPGRARP